MESLDAKESPAFWQLVRELRAFLSSGVPVSRARGGRLETLAPFPGSAVPPRSLRSEDGLDVPEKSVRSRVFRYIRVGGFRAGRGPLS